MTLSSYLLYLAAVALLILTPGPTMLMCITNAINHGPRCALNSAAGSVTAVIGVMLLSAMGLGALLAASEAAFTTGKVVGAAYLIWLGVKTFLSSNSAVEMKSEMQTDARSFYIQGLLVGASNPKAILFFAAFFPQFLNPAEPLLPQVAVLAATFVVFELAVLTACALGAARVVPLLKSQGPVRWINRVCGALFVGIGGLMLLARR